MWSPSDVDFLFGYVVTRFIYSAQGSILQGAVNGHSLTGVDRKDNNRFHLANTSHLHLTLPICYCIYCHHHHLQTVNCESAWRPVCTWQQIFKGYELVWHLFDMHSMCWTKLNSSRGLILGFPVTLHIRGSSVDIFELSNCVTTEPQASSVSRAGGKPGHVMSVYVFMCVCVCERERERLSV